jgi:hypothetical protein
MGKSWRADSRNEKFRKAKQNKKNKHKGIKFQPYETEPDWRKEDSQQDQ